jgi:chitin synthase
VEYRFSHFLEKATESMIGFITVLPGAFSSYRWAKLNNPYVLSEYFKMIETGRQFDIDNSPYFDMNSSDVTPTRRTTQE